MTHQVRLNKIVDEMYEASCGAKQKTIDEITRLHSPVVLAERITKRLWDEHYLVNSTMPAGTPLDPDYKVKWLNEIIDVVEGVLRAD